MIKDLNLEALKDFPREILTRELWLKAAVSVINEVIFEGEMPDKDFQINVGRVKSKKTLGECLSPREDRDEFFPTTIHLSEKIDNPQEIIGVLIHECIHCFYEAKSHGKFFSAVAYNAGLIAPFKEYHPSDELTDNIKLIYNKLVILLGDFPHQAIKESVNIQKERKKSTYTLFCDCGFECTAKKDMVEKFGIPTCACGKKMGVDYEEGKEE